MKPLLHALRQLRRSPVFTTASIVSLALGIGANTAVFSLVYALLLRPLAVREPDRLVQVGITTADGRTGGLPTPVADLLRREGREGRDGIFQSVCSFLTPMAIVEVNGRVTPRSGHAVSGDCFETLGVGIAAGRAIGREDDTLAAPRVAMLTYDVWQREFGGRADAIGKTIAIDGEAATIVGVTERRFNGVLLGFPPQIVYPLEALQQRIRVVTKDQRRTPTALVFARIAPETSIAQVNARLQTMWPRLLQESLDSYQAAESASRVAGTGGGGGADERAQYLAQKITVAPAAIGLDFTLRSRFDKPLYALLAVAAIVLLVTCANVANLLLARAAQRRSEVAIRLALGASRWQLMRDVLIESTLLLIGGVGGGLLIAYWGNQIVLSRFGAAYTAFALDVTPDARVLAFTGSVAAAAFVAFALTPAWRTSRADSREILGSSSSSRVHGDRGRLRQVLVVAQVALTLTLVTGALLFSSVLANLESTPLGIETAGVISAQLGDMPSASRQNFGQNRDRQETDRNTNDRALLDRLTRVPGIRAAALTNFTPLFGRPSMESTASPAASVLAEQAVVTDGFFSVMRIPLVAGEGFRHTIATAAPSASASPSAGAPPRVAIVSESLARTLFGRRDPIGERIQVGRDRQARTLDIVGVARDAVLTRPQSGNTLVVYQRFDQSPILTPSLIVGTASSSDARRMIDAIGRELQLDGRWHPVRLRTLTEDRDAALAQERLLAWVSSAFGVLGLTLAAVGLYGLLALSVARRTSEIGIRMALGADRARVVGMIVREAIILIAAGVIIGLPIAWAAGRGARALLPGVGQMPLPIVALAIVVITLAGALAAWIPARRASSIAPLLALRRE